MTLPFKSVTIGILTLLFLTAPIFVAGCSNGGGSGSGGTITPPQDGSGTLVFWEPVTTDINGQPETVVEYRVYLTEESNDFDFSTPIRVVTSPEVSLQNLQTDQFYYVTVTAVDASGNESVAAEPVVFSVQ